MTPVRTSLETGKRVFQHGFTYLWLLFILAVGGVALAAIGQRTSTTAQRDREAELMFRGAEIARAIAAYRAATPGTAKVLPASLQDLLDDRRSGVPVHHLRRVYSDPFTGREDWILVRTDDGLITGVHSSASEAALRTLDLPTPPAGRRATESDRVFTFGQFAARVASAPRAAPASSQVRPDTAAPE